MSKSNDIATDPLANRTGVYLMPGVSVRIPRRGLEISIDENGEAKAELKALHVALGMTPQWLGIAIGHVVEARRQHHLLLEARHAGHDAELRVPMEAEFVASMQACTAIAVALDAMYAMLKAHVTVELSLIQAWRRKGTARHKQVFEILRRATDMGPKSAGNVRIALREIYKFRDMAVHPHADFGPPVRHPDFGFGVESRIFTFRYANAYTLVRGGLGVVYSASARPHPKARQSLEGVYKDLYARTSPLVAAWEASFGPLFDQTSADEPHRSAAPTESTARERPLACREF